MHFLELSKRAVYGGLLVALVSVIVYYSIDDIRAMKWHDDGSGKGLSIEKRVEFSKRFQLTSRCDVKSVRQELIEHLLVADARMFAGQASREQRIFPDPSILAQADGDVTSVVLTAADLLYRRAEWTRDGFVKISSLLVDEQERSPCFQSTINNFHEFIGLAGSPLLLGPTK